VVFICEICFLDLRQTWKLKWERTAMVAPLAAGVVAGVLYNLRQYT
jgi:hypothetical protein